MDTEIILWIIAWVICVPTSYVLMKKVITMDGDEPNDWTQGIRIVFIILSLGGPLSFGAAIFMFVLFYVLTHYEKPAKW